MSKLISSALAIAFSFLLFVVMTVLIKPKPRLVVKSSHAPISIHYKVNEAEPERINRVPPKLEIRVKSKRVSTIKESIEPDLAKPGFKVASLVQTDGLTVLDVAPASTNWGRRQNGQAMPRVRINPLYPDKAMRDNIEGYITLTFDISEMGRPINVQVVDADPSGYFERAARKALKKWKYDPKIVDEKAVMQPSQIVTLSFQLASES